MALNQKRLMRGGAIFGFGVLLYLLLMRWGLLMPASMVPGVLCLPKCHEKLHQKTDQALRLNESRSLQSLIGDNTTSEQISLLVEKSDYRLTLYEKGKPVKSYPIVLGTNPTGDKQREGDLKTPEGVFRVRDLYPHPSWSKFIWLDYPTSASWRKHFKAKLAGDIGPFDSIGGQVGIHGVPSSGDRWIEAGKNWTWGCISLTNADVDEIYDVIGPGTRVEILP